MVSLRVHRSLGVFSVLFLLLIFTSSGCKDDPVDPVHGGDLWGTVRSADGRPVGGASVYLAQAPMYFSSPVPFVMDSVTTDWSGHYEFGDLDGENLVVYAGKWDLSGDDFSAVSPFSPSFDFAGKSALEIWNPLLMDVQSDGVVSGKVLIFDGTQWVAADSVEVTVERYRGAEFVVAGGARSGKTGDYAVPVVPTANCIAHGSRIIEGDSPFPAYLAGDTPPFFCDGRNLVRAPDLLLREQAVEKPAIYIYPATAGRFRVELDLNHRVRMTRSIPAYGEGWKVHIDEDGLMDGKWDYLFYEAALQGAPLLHEGWCLAAGDRETGLERIVRQLGLNEHEARDFLAYWLRRLPRSSWLSVKPLMGPGLDHLVRVRAEPAPDSMRRFWLLFSPAERVVELPAPVVEPFVRRGTVLVEWGGAVVPPAP